MNDGTNAARRAKQAPSEARIAARASPSLTLTRLRIREIAGDGAFWRDFTGEKWKANVGQAGTRGSGQPDQLKRPAWQLKSPD